MILCFCFGSAVHAAPDYSELPLSFEANHGQTDPAVRFLARGASSTLFLTCREAVLQWRAQQPNEAGEATRRVLRLRFAGTDRECRAAGVDRRQGQAHYFSGRDPDSWTTHAPLYGKVRYEEVYPGVDALFYGNERRLEYDFIVAPGADPSRIRLELEGADELAIDERGRLVAVVAGEEVVQQAPTLYQPRKSAETDGAPEREAVTGRWKLLADNTAAFEWGDYDRSRPLVIDPVLAYSTFLGGGVGSAAFDIAVDEAGFAHVVGDTEAPDFPTTAGAVQPNYGGGRTNAFVVKLTPEGDDVVFSTFLGGGEGVDQAHAVDLDPQGNVYVFGEARGGDFPLTDGAFDDVFSGGTTFVAKLPPDGSELIYSTLVGEGGEIARGLAVDDDGFAYVTGRTPADDFPLVNPIQNAIGDIEDAFIAKLNQDGSDLVFSTFYGGAARPQGGIQAEDTGEAIAVDEDGNVYVTGHTRSADFPTTPGAYQTTLRGVRDAFLLKLDPSGSRVLYATLLGGERNDWGYDIAVDAFQQAHVAGFTDAGDETFPVTAGALRTEPRSGEGFVAKFSSDGNSLRYSTLVGGRGNVEPLEGIVLDTAGHAYVAGYSNNIGGFDSVRPVPEQDDAGNQGAVFAKLSVDGSRALVWTGFGGDDVEQAHAIGIDGNCRPILAGETRSADFPTVNAFQPASSSGERDFEAFVTKIDTDFDSDEPRIGCRGVAQASGTPVLREGAPNSIMSVFGSGFAPPGVQALNPEVDAAGRVTTRLADTCVEVNGIRSPIYAVFPNQVNFQNPHQLGSGWASYRVVRGCGTGSETYSEPEHIRIRPAAPAFFNFVNHGDGMNPIAALHEDGVSLLGPPDLFGEEAETTPASPGEFVSLFGTGWGPTAAGFEAGQVPGVTSSLTSQAEVRIGDIAVPPGDVFYVGIAPCCAGLYQLVVKIPDGAPSGNLPVTLTIAGRSSWLGPYVAVQR